MYNRVIFFIFFLFFACKSAKAEEEDDLSDVEKRYLLNEGRNLEGFEEIQHNVDIQEEHMNLNDLLDEPPRYLKKGPINCNGVTTKCKCNQAKPLLQLILFDVSRSIDINDMYEIYQPALEKMKCGLNLGVSEGEANSDAVGVIIFGWATKNIVKIRKHTDKSYHRQLTNAFKSRHQRGFVARKCCTPLLSALDLAYRAIKEANDDGYIDLNNMRVRISIVTDGYAVQNRYNPRSPFFGRKWTQEKEYPGEYENVLIPTRAKDLKDDYNAQINLILLENRKDLAMEDAIDYFEGRNRVAITSRKRKPGSIGKKYYGKEKTSFPINFPVLSGTNGFTTKASDTITSGGLADIFIKAACTDGERHSYGSPRCPTPPPTPKPTPEPTTKLPTKSPTMAPTKSPTPPTTPSPTAVKLCGKTQDLIIMTDTSNSISYNQKGKEDRLKNSIIPLVGDLAKIQNDNDPDSLTAILTFSKVIAERLKLGQYSHTEIDDFIQKLLKFTGELLGCCTPLAEVIDLATKVLEDRPVKRTATCIILTDGVPWLQQSPYEGSNDEESTDLKKITNQYNELHYRRGSNGYTYAKYFSHQVFKSADKLKQHCEVFMVGLKNKFGKPTGTNYFSGKMKFESCVTTGKKNNDWTCGPCNSCTTTNTPDNDCYAIQAKDNTGMATCDVNDADQWYPAIVSEPVDDHVFMQESGVSDKELTQKIRDLLCE